MKRRMITLPELALIAGTRAALGAGIGLLVADRMDRSVRRAVGWTLVSVGALSTIPLAAHVLRSEVAPPRMSELPPVTAESEEAQALWSHA